MLPTPSSVEIPLRVLLFQFDTRRHSIAGWRFAYSKEGDSDNDAPVLGARKLVDGVADVAVALDGAAGADTSVSFGRHVVLCFVCGMWFSCWVMMMFLDARWMRSCSLAGKVAGSGEMARGHVIRAVRKTHEYLSL